jgi:hypothetical protein
MLKSIENTILKKIHGNGKGWVFSAKDFANSGSRSAVDLALHRLEHKGKIRRVFRGIYYIPKFSELLGQDLSADIDHIAQAIARKFGWSIQPSEAMAQNLIGISTQVPARALYMSDGPDRTYQIDQTKLIFRHQALKDTGFKRRESGLIIQAVKSLRQNRVTPQIISKIRAWLPPALRKKVLVDTKTTAGWIYDVIKEITRENSHG